MMDFMLFFNICVAAYMLYTGFKGSGKNFDVDYPEEAKKKHTHIMRVFCLSVGSVMLVLSIVELVLYNTEGMSGIAYVISWINIGLVLGAIVVYLVITRKLFGKYQGR